MNLNYLSNLNFHPNDSNIAFQEDGHIYTVKHPGVPEGDKDFMSVTTYIHSLFEDFDSDKIINNMMKSSNWDKNKYYGMKKDDIKQLWREKANLASLAGSKLHYDIECFYNKIPVTNDSIEYNYFLKFHNDFVHLKEYRTEWIIYHEELRLAGSIDMVFINNSNCLEIYDWKRVKDIVKNNKWNKWSKNNIISYLPDTNYWHYALQLNIYKAILVEKYGMTVDKLYLVSLHPENKSYIRIPVCDLQNEIRELFNQRLKYLKNSSK